MTEDFELWTRRFESYCRAAKVADGLKCDVLLAALDDNAFRAVDALGLSDKVRNDYSQLMAALKERFSPTTCEFELCFRPRRCIQHEGESSNDFAGALTRQGNRLLPDFESKARSEIIQDQVIEGIRDSYIQERLLQDGPSTLKEALKTARKLGAARSAQQSLRTTTAAELRAVSAVSDSFNLQQEVRRTVQEALKDYLPVQESGPAEVQSVQQCANFPSVEDVGVVADMDAWIISQLDHLGPPMRDPSASSERNQVISAFIALNADLQLEPTVLDVVGEDMLEMNAPLGLRSRKTTGYATAINDST